MAPRVIKLEKNLLGKEDVHFGRGGSTQIRNGRPIQISKIPALISVENISELQNTDPREFDSVLVISKEPMIAPAQVQTEMNEFYKYDFTTNAQEDYPSIIASNVIPNGRWVLTRIGGGQIKDFVDQAVESLKEDILHKVEESIDSKVTEAAKASLLAIKKQGGLYESGITYTKGDLCKVVVRENETYLIRNFLVTSESITNTPPVTGNSVMVGTLKVYENAGLSVNTTDYVEIFSSNSNTLIAQQDSRKTYTYLPPLALDGTLKVKFRSADGLVTASMDIVFNGSSYSDFMIRNVMYSKNVRQDNFMKTEAFGKIFYSGVALHISQDGVGFSIWDNKYARIIELDYSNLNVKASLSSTKEVSTRSCYALREGGGSYIQGICTIIPDVRPNQVNSGDTIEFHHFMLGGIHWNTSLQLDRDIYHQFYDAGGVDLSADPSDACLGNTLNGQNSGSIYKGQLPDLKGSVGMLHHPSSNNLFYIWDLAVKGMNEQWRPIEWSGFYPEFSSSVQTNNLLATTFYGTTSSIGDKYKFYAKISLKLSEMIAVNNPDGFNPYRNGTKIIPESLKTRFLVIAF